MRGAAAKWRGSQGPVRTAVRRHHGNSACAAVPLSPAELEALGWSFAGRKRLLDHFLSSGKQAQRPDPGALGATPLKLKLPLRDVRRLRAFVHRELPKGASNAALLDRLRKTLHVLP